MMYYINEVFSQIDARRVSHVLSNQANDCSILLKKQSTQSAFDEPPFELKSTGWSSSQFA